MRQIILNSIIVILFTSSSFGVGDKETINELLKSKYKDIKSKNYIVVVNTISGCGSCLKMVDNFIKKNADNKHFIFIVPFTSMKTMNINLGKKILNSSNVIIDKENLAIEKELVTTVPSVFFVDNGNITKKILLEANNISYHLASLK